MQNWIQSLGLIPFLFIGIAISLTMAEVKEIIEISSLVGIEIDRTENKKYNLFPEHRGFLRAEFLKIGNADINVYVYIRKVHVPEHFPIDRAAASCATRFSN